MLYTDELEDLVFSRHLENHSDEITVISGYVQPSPVKRLSTLPLKKCSVYYGMYGEAKISQTLHESLLGASRRNLNLELSYSLRPVHSKCYIWSKDGEIIDALIGSANFSTNGLNTPFREMLSTFTPNYFPQLNSYLSRLKDYSIPCTSSEIQFRGKPYYINQDEADTKNIPTTCLLSLLQKNGQIHNPGAGLNWGQNPEHNTCPSDAYIPIFAEHLRNFPNLFPPKKIYGVSLDGGGKKQRQNEPIEIIWDDGTSMKALLEGVYNDKKNNIKYPKQISSFPEKATLGLYLRNRIGIGKEDLVSKKDLEVYGRTNVEVSLIEEGLYYFDFSAN